MLVRGEFAKVEVWVFLLSLSFDSCAQLPHVGVTGINYSLGHEAEVKL